MKRLLIILPKREAVEGGALFNFRQVCFYRCAAYLSYELIEKNNMTDNVVAFRNLLLNFAEHAWDERENPALNAGSAMVRNFLAMLNIHGTGCTFEIASLLTRSADV